MRSKCRIPREGSLWKLSSIQPPASAECARTLSSSRHRGFGDRAFEWLTLAMALAVVVSGFPRRLAIGARLAARDQDSFGFNFLTTLHLGSGGGTIRRVAVYLRHDRFVADRADHRCAAEHRHRRLSDRAGSALDSTAARLADRNAGRDSERHSRSVGNFCHDSVAARSSVSLARSTLRMDAVFQRTDLRSRACSPAESSSRS